MSAQAYENVIHVPDTAGAVIAAVRKKVGITQSELGKRLGITQGRISQLEKAIGKTSFATVMQLANELGLEVVLRPRRPKQAAW